MVRGVAVDGLPERHKQPVRPIALAIEGREAIVNRSGLTATDILRELLSGSETGGDLVTLRVDYLAAMIALGSHYRVGQALWQGEQAQIGEYLINLVPALCLWIRTPERTIRVNDIQRWVDPDFAKTAAIFTPGRDAPDAPTRWRWSDTSLDVETAMFHVKQMAEWTGEIAREVDSALGRAKLGRYWRDGTGRVAGAMLDRMAFPADIAQPPLVLADAIATAYVGGRISIFQAGRWERITQWDVKSAYPWAMAQLPSLDGADWIRKRWYEPECPHALWRVSWDVPKGAVSGPFPVRVRTGAIAYPLAGSGWYWDDEVRAAVECYGRSLIQPSDGFAIRPQSDRRPFEGLLGHYETRAALKRLGDLSAAHVAKLAHTSCYGRLAQVMQWNGRPGRWGNLALAGIVTSTVRARMMRELWEHETTAIAIATDSLTIAGDAPERAADHMGGWSVTTGGDALMLPSGVFRVETGTAAMDRVSGVERSRSLLIDWPEVYKGWDVLGMALSYKVGVPVFCGLGMAGSMGQWGKLGTWRLQQHEIVGTPDHAKPVRAGPRTWRLMPQVSAPMRANKYVPRSGLIGRTHDQDTRMVPDVAREHDQPFA